jgi:hypothetical protein
MGKVSKSAAAAAMFWLALAKVGRGVPLLLMVVATALAQAQTLVKSIIVAHSVSIMALRCCSSISLASRVARSPVSSSYH